MSKAIPSDGTTNALVLEMCLQGLAEYRREDVDKVLTNEGRLKHCELPTLCLAMYAYCAAFGEKCWPVQKHIELKAWQSSTYRAYMGAKAKRRGAGAAPLEGDPLHALLSQKPAEVQEGAEKTVSKEQIDAMLAATDTLQEIASTHTTQRSHRHDPERLRCRGSLVDSAACRVEL